ncbi:MAG: TIM barrel protein [Lentisphaerales bacterium]|nr:TIM barrel protein [Lentisphaerales bacterium]
MDRRNLLKMAGGSLALSSISCQSATVAGSSKSFPFKKSFCFWCYKDHWGIEQQIDAALKLGCDGIELVDPKHFDKLKAAGLECSLTTSHGYTKGMNNKIFHDENIKKMKERIDVTKKYGFSNVITFVGFADTTKFGGSKIDPEEGIKNCIEGYKKIIGYAEKKGITLQMEILNSRVEEKMKGHPGFAGDTVEYCGEIIRAIGSENLKILFDIYHVQVMQGDLITRIGENADIIGHIHTAGCPGRNELDDTQEINYPAVMKKLKEIGYKDYVTHEFIPTREPYNGLVEAFERCSI